MLRMNWGNSSTFDVIDVQTFSTRRGAAGSLSELFSADRFGCLFNFEHRKAYYMP